MSLYGQPYQNKLNKGLGNQPGFLIRTLPDTTIGLKELVEELAFGTTATQGDIELVMTNLKRSLIRHLLQGRRIKTPFATFQAKIKGGLNSPRDRYLPPRNYIEIQIRLDSEINNEVNQKVQVEIIEGSKETIPSPIIFENRSTGDHKIIAEGNLGMIEGYRLAFDMADTNQGVFFVPENGASPIRVAEYADVKNNKIYFKCPALPAGEYTLSVSAIFGANLRRGNNTDVITVL